MTQPSPLPGWYPDPSGVPGQRYWDGQTWGPKAPAQQQPQVVINNTVATPAPVYVATGPNHALHAVLSLLTCGAWLPIWIIIAIVDAGSSHAVIPQTPFDPAVVSRVRQQRSQAGTVIVVIFAVIGGLLLGAARPVAIPFVVLMALGGGIGYWYWRRGEDQRAEQDRIAARADAEYRAYLEGNPAGTYGQYPPPPLPEPDQWPPPNLPWGSH
jgi:hypothetical protein